MTTLSMPDLMDLSIDLTYGNVEKDNANPLLANSSYEHINYYAN